MPISIKPSIPSTSICKFQQTAAPVGWTKITTYNDYSLRVTSGTVTSAGTRNFSAVFTNQTPTAAGTMGSVTGVSINPANAGATSHRHSWYTAPLGNYYSDPLGAAVPTLIVFGQTGAAPASAITSTVGSGTAHNHSVTVPSTYASPSILPANADFSITYVDMIIAQRN